jgi:hypothetical protein
MRIKEVTGKGAGLRTSRWRIIIPPRITGTGKRKTRHFRTREEAEAEISRLTQRDKVNSIMTGKPTVVTDDMIHVIKIGDDQLSAIQAFIEAIRNQKSIILTLRNLSQ